MQRWCRRYRCRRGRKGRHGGPAHPLALRLGGLYVALSLLDPLIELGDGLLGAYGVEGSLREGAPGVFVGEAKIASLGLRVRRGRSFHGLAFNIDMDLEPFGRINPCGYPGLQVTQLADYGIQADLYGLGRAFSRILGRFSLVIICFGSIPICCNCITVCFKTSVTSS